MVKVICDAIQEFEDLFDLEMEFNKNRGDLVDVEGNKIKFKLKLDNLTVKYTPDRFDKLVVDVNNKEDRNALKLLENTINEAIPENLSARILKDTSLGIKLDTPQKMAVQNLKKGNNIDVVIAFNGVWNVSGKYYVSFTLVQFKQNEVKQENYFSDV